MTSAALKNPKLRFPEFKDHWGKVSIKDLTNRVSIPVTVENDQLYTQIGIRSHGKGLFHKQAVTGKELGNKRVFWVKNGLFVVNIVFAWEQAVAKTTRNELGTIASHRFPMFRPKSDLLNLDFLLFSFLTKRGKSLLELASPGGAGRNKTLGQEEFNRTKINVPCVEEQEKIADFLLAVDEKILQLTNKKELLLKYKKGLMRQIFDQKIRFKDKNGNDFADWKEKRFGELFLFLPTNSFSREDLNYLEGDVRNIHYGDIHTKFRALLNADEEEIPFINKEISLAQISEANYLRTGDLVFADASEDYADVGKCIEIGRTNGQRMLSGLHTLLARPKGNELARIFGAYLMQSSSVRRQIIREAQGTKVLGISTARLAKVKFMLPPLAEQAKIAAFISTLERKIEIVSRELKEVRVFKNSLLQQMFV
jgi:type I restriction enzyme S subunit